MERLPPEVLEQLLNEHVARILLADEEEPPTDKEEEEERAMHVVARHQLASLVRLRSVSRLWREVVGVAGWMRLSGHGPRLSLVAPQFKAVLHNDDPCLVVPLRCCPHHERTLADDGLVVAREYVHLPPTASHEQEQRLAAAIASTAAWSNKKLPPGVFVFHAADSRRELRMRFSAWSPLFPVSGNSADPTDDPTVDAVAATLATMHPTASSSAFDDDDSETDVRSVWSGPSSSPRFVPRSPSPSPLPPFQPHSPIHSPLPQPSYASSTISRSSSASSVSVAAHSMNTPFSFMLDLSLPTGTYTHSQNALFSITYSIERIEREIVRWVPRPGRITAVPTATVNTSQSTLTNGRQRTYSSSSTVSSTHSLVSPGSLEEQGEEGKMPIRVRDVKCCVRIMKVCITEKFMVLGMG